MKGIVEEAQRMTGKIRTPRYKIKARKRGTFRYTAPDGTVHVGTLPQIMKVTGCTHSIKTVERRINIGWSVEDAIELPLQKKRKAA